MEEAGQALLAITSLCEEALVEAEDVMDSLQSAPAIVAPSPAALSKSVSIYDKSFCSQKSQVFYSKDKQLKLIAFKRNGNNCQSSNYPPASVKSSEEERVGHEQEFFYNGICYKLKVDALIEKNGLKAIEINNTKARF